MVAVGAFAAIVRAVHRVTTLDTGVTPKVGVPGPPRMCPDGRHVAVAVTEDVEEAPEGSVGTVGVAVLVELVEQFPDKVRSVGVVVGELAVGSLVEGNVAEVVDGDRRQVAPARPSTTVRLRAAVLEDGASAALAEDSLHRAVSPMGVPGGAACCTRGVAVHHRPAAPPGDAHQVAFVASVSEVVVGKRVAELVGVDVADPRLRGRRMTSWRIPEVPSLPLSPSHSHGESACSWRLLARR